MADEVTGQVAPDVGQPPPEIGSFVNPDGTFKEGWQQTLVPEDFRDLGVFKTVTDLPTAMKQLGNLEKLRGKQGKSLMPLTDDSTDTERELFYNAIGRPAKPDGYKYEVPKGLEEYYADPMVKESLGALHKAGLTQKQVEAVLALDAGRVNAFIEQAQLQEKTMLDTATAELKKRWGAAYDARMQLAEKMVQDNAASPEDADQIRQYIGKNPYLVDFLSSIGKKFMEGTVVHTDTSSQGKMTPGEAKLKMNEKIAEMTQDINLKYNNPAKYARLNQEIQTLAGMVAQGQG